MNKFYKGYDDITASDVFKSRMVRTLTGRKETKPAVLRPSRRVAAVLIAAAALILAMGTAVAVGLSTAGRLRQTTEERLDTSEEERLLAARETAVRIVNDASYARIIPLHESAALQDVTLNMRSVELDGDELMLTFAADSETTGMVLDFESGISQEDVHAQRILDAFDTFCEIGMDARDFRLSFGGSAYVPYYTDDMPSAIGYGNADDLVIRFLDLPKITNGTEMTLSGTLYRCDGEGNRTGEIGAFEIPFVFDYTDAMREADIERETREILDLERTRDEQQQVNLDKLPEEATSLEQTVGMTVYHDVSADERGILLGLTNTLGGEGFEQFRYYCMNGYRVAEEEVAYEWNDAMNANTVLLRLPYYAQLPYLDSVLTVACVNISGQATKTDEGWLEPEHYEQDVLVFRYDLNTGKVTLPKDEQERDAWFTPEPLTSSHRVFELMKPGYDIINVETDKQEQNGVSVCIRRVAFCEDGTMEIFYQAENMACEVMTWETFPKEIRINGEPVPRDVFRAWDFDWQPFRLTDDRIAEIIDSYSMEKTRWVIDSWKVVPEKRFDMYDGPITIEINDWDLYDLNKQGEREYVGTFSFRFTVDPADAYTQQINSREGLQKK